MFNFETEDLSVNLESLTSDKLKKLRDKASDNLHTLQLEVTDLENYIDYINSLINKKGS